MQPRDRDEYLEYKRLAEQRRRAKIKRDAELHEVVKAKARARYHKRKAEKKIIPISEMTSQQKNKVRKQNRIKSRLYRKRMKERKNAILNEELIPFENPNLGDDDPLSLSPLQPSQSVAAPLSTLGTSATDISPLLRPCTRLSKRQNSTSSNTVNTTALQIRPNRLSPTLNDDPLLLSPLQPSKSVAAPLSTLGTSATDISPVLRPCTRLSKRQNSTSSNTVNTTALQIRPNPLSPTSNGPELITQTAQTTSLSSFIELTVNDDNLNTSTSLPLSPTNSFLSSDDSSPAESPTRDRTKVKLHMKSKAIENYKRKSRMRLMYENKALKESRIMHKRVQELKSLNSKYRQQLSRMKHTLLAMKGRRFETDTDTSSREDESENTENEIPDTNQENKLFKDVKLFYLDDENSRMCAGKRDYITKKKEKQQKRYLNDSIQNIHKKFLHDFPDHKISYSKFCKLRPFWVLAPSLKERDTCMCKLHANMELIVKSLRRNNIITENSPTEILKAKCCDASNLICLGRNCNICKHKSILYKEFNNDHILNYDAWRKSAIEYKKNGVTKTTVRTAKEKVSATPVEIIKEFERQLDPYMFHCRNIISQNSHVKKIKNNLTEQEAIIHCDFSENYCTKYAQEIQAFHFGSSRTQITLHTVVIYFLLNGKLESKALCTFSSSLRHDAVAIWEHLIPVLTYIQNNAPTVNSIHFISDSPSAQYRNRRLFYIITRLHWYFPNLVFITWNYSESGHGKGAPDGVGGTLKRTADRVVARGHDIPNLETLLDVLKRNIKGVIIEKVEESSIFEKDMLMPATLPNFRGTMGVHQVVWHVNNIDSLTMRKLSCSLDECAISPVECTHGQHVGFYILKNSPEQNQNKDIITEPISRKLTKPSRVQILSDERINLSVSAAKRNLTENQNYTAPGSSSCNKKTTRVSPTKDLSLPLPLDDSFWQSVSSVDANCPSVSNIIFSTLNINDEDAINDDDDEDVDNLRIF